MKSKQHNKKNKKCKKCMIGMTKEMECGKKATIIAYKNKHDMKIQFEDGVVKKHVKKGDFMKGTVKYPNEKINTSETPTKTNPDKKINTSETPTKTNETPRKKRMRNTKDEMIGMVRTMKNGMKAKIIDYQDSKHMTIQFEDDTIVENVRKDRFMAGCTKCQPKQKNTKTIANAKKYMGLEKIMNCGEKVTITNYNDYNDIDVTFEDNTVKKHVRVSSFLNGSVRKPKTNDSDKNKS